MTTAIIPERLERFLSPDVHLRKGPGSGIDRNVDVCAMQAVAWLAGEPNTDKPKCACPIIAAYVVRLNDSRLFTGHRDMLKPYCPQIAGTRATRNVERKRAFIAIDFAVRSFAPIALRALKRDDLAAKLEAVARITDKATAITARDMAREVKVAAKNAYAVAAAAAYAAAKAAYAAAKAAYAYAYADTDVYVYAAAAAAADAAADEAIRAKALECLDAMIAAA